MNFWASSQKCRSRIYIQGVRYSSAVDNHAFSQSLLLPQTSFPLRHSNPTKTEARLRARTCTDLYQWQSKNAERPEFILHDGPPYANGDLHMGHALNKILKDIINRFHLSRGWRVQYIPGWDCHGLPIENKALLELGEDSASLPPLAIRNAAHKTALREVDSQKEQFQRLGIMADWSNEATYRTIDHSYQIVWTTTPWTLGDAASSMPKYIRPKPKAALVADDLTSNVWRTLYPDCGICFSAIHPSRPPRMLPFLALSARGVVKAPVLARG
ncbi:hypothetical protein FB451DRAFT_1393262 [Mycena latifolia]|nr:hypothetical protein FB451DRAFT_1393262 [Mycena latifolia]